MAATDNLNLLSEVACALGSLPSSGSRLYGTSFNKHHNRWESYVRVNSEKICLGYYSSEEAAWIAREKAIDYIEHGALDWCKLSWKEFRDKIRMKARDYSREE